MKRIALSPLIVVAACTQTVEFPPDLWGDTWDYYYTDSSTFFPYATGETGTPPATELRVARAFGECNGVNGSMSFATITTGWTGTAIFTVFRAADGRIEDHPMNLTDLDPAGSWDRWDVSLLDGASPTEWEASTTTGFDCATDASTLTYAIRLDQTVDLTSTTQDCVLWGADPGSLAAVLVTSDPDLELIQDCRVITL